MCVCKFSSADTDCLLWGRVCVFSFHSTRLNNFCKKTYKSLIMLAFSSSDRHGVSLGRLHFLETSQEGVTDFLGDKLAKMSPDTRSLWSLDDLQPLVLGGPVKNETPYSNFYLHVFSSVRIIFKLSAQWHSTSEKGFFFTQSLLKLKLLLKKLGGRGFFFHLDHSPG